DRAAAGLAHVRKDEARETHRREERDAYGFLPRRVVEIVEAPRRRTARVRNEDVDRPELVDGGLHELLTSLGGAHVRDRPLHLGAGLALHPFGSGTDRRLVAAAHHDSRALACEFLGDGTAKSLAGCGDDRDFVAEAEIHRAIVPPCGETSLGSVGFCSPPALPISA